MINMPLLKCKIEAASSNTIRLSFFDKKAGLDVVKYLLDNATEHYFNVTVASNEVHVTVRFPDFMVDEIV